LVSHDGYRSGVRFNSQPSATRGPTRRTRPAEA
jgi:hypothetical protein